MHLVREYNALGRGNVAIVLDTKGPEVRSGDLAEPIDMKPGARSGAKAPCNNVLYCRPCKSYPAPLACAPLGEVRIVVLFPYAGEVVLHAGALLQCLAAHVWALHAMQLDGSHPT